MSLDQSARKVSAISNDDAYAALLTSVGQASFRREAWDDVLVRLADVAGARGAAVIPLRGNVHDFRHTESLAALADAYVATGWATRDYRNRAVPKMLSGQVAVDADFIDYDTLRHEPYYEDFLRPLGFRHFAGLAVRNGEDVWAVTLQRRVDDEPFSVAEQARLATLIEPLQAAVTLGQALADAYARGSLDRLDTSDKACLLLDRLGRVVHMNRAAEAMLGASLFVRHGVVSMSSRELTRGLHARIEAKLTPPSIDPALPPLVQRGPDGLRVIEVLRLPDMEADAFGRCRCMILIHATGAPIPLDVAAFRAMFSLSRHEAALAAALSRSRSLVRAAQDLGISHETARSQLKSIFAKTGARSQTELAVLMGELSAIGRSADRGS